MKERGGALVLALFATAALLLLGTVFLATSLSEKTVAANETLAARAFGIAEAGLEHGRANLVTADVDTVLAGGGTLLSSQSLGGGTYTVLITNNIDPPFPLGTVPADAGGATNDTDGYLVVTSTGLYQKGRRQVEQIVRKMSGGSTTLHYAVYGDSAVSLDDDGGINGDTGTNASVTDIDSFIHGNVRAVGTVANQSNVTPRPPYVITQSAASVTLPAVSCPGLAYGGPALGGSTGTFNAGTGDITFSSGSNTTFSSGTYYYHNFRHTGDGDLRLAAGATVDVYVSGRFEQSGHGDFNVAGNAANLRIWGCGASTVDWEQSDHGNLYGTIYGPRHDFNLSGHGGIWGSLYGKRIEITGKGDVTYNASVTVPGTLVAVVAGSWAEVF